MQFSACSSDLQEPKLSERDGNIPSIRDMKG